MKINWKILSRKLNHYSGNENIKTIEIVRKDEFLDDIAFLFHKNYICKSQNKTELSIIFRGISSRR